MITVSSHIRISIVVRHWAQETIGRFLGQCSVNLKKFRVVRKLFLVKNGPIVTVSWCRVWRSQSTKSKHPFKQPLWLKLVHTMGSKQGPREHVSSFRLTCLGWCQMVTPKPADSPLSALSPLVIFLTCSDGIPEYLGACLTLIGLYWIDVCWKYAKLKHFFFPKNFALSLRDIIINE